MRGRAVCLCAVLLGAALLLESHSGQAHALLRRAEPGVGATIHASPSNLRLWFTEKLEIAFSQVDVLDSEGHSVLAGKPRIAPDDPKELIAPLKPSLSSGRYHVRWKAVSVDTHVTQGAFTFKLAN